MDGSGKNNFMSKNLSHQWRRCLLTLYFAVFYLKQLPFNEEENILKVLFIFFNVMTALVFGRWCFFMCSLKCLISIWVLNRYISLNSHDFGFTPLSSIIKITRRYLKGLKVVPLIIAQVSSFLNVKCYYKWIIAPVCCQFESPHLGIIPRLHTSCL